MKLWLQTLLRKEIERYNEFDNTDFEIIEIAEEIEAEFCKIKTTADESHIFKLRFGLARYEEELRQEDKID
ncbi:hypothetical protein ACQ1Q5_02775 [Ornithobacterium rhinotracheale]